MYQQAKEQLMVVMLENLIQQTLPRILSIRHKLEQGEVLLSSEIDFFMEMLEKINQCQRDFKKDAQCMVIFTTVAHLLNKVAEMALKNEQASKVQLA